MSGSRTFADQYTWIGTLNSEWCEPLNWENSSGNYPDGYPGENNSTHDTATLDANCIGPCEDITLAKLTIKNGGCVNLDSGYKLNITRLLTIESSGKLYIKNGEVELSANNRSHKIGGYIELSLSTSTLLISGNSSLDPFAPTGAALQYGTVKGLHNDASIAICYGKTLTNNITICGMMTIKSTSCGSTATGGETVIASKNRAAEKTIRTKNKVADKAKPQKLRTKKTLPVAISTTTSSVICYI